MVAGVAWAWWPDSDTYRPVQPDEGGTLMDGINTLAAPIGLSRPEPAASMASTSQLEVGQQATARAAWDTTDPLPSKEEPRLALVMVPRPGQTTASGEEPTTWVFPFDKPLAPGPGDNQAMAVNTTDGTVVYDTAFALVWVDDGEAALNTNESYAFASCTSCGAVAVSFQVVFTVGDNDVAVPQNLAGAVNYDCVNCLTYALAKQLFVTLDGPLSDTAMRELDRLWAEIAEYGADIRDVPLEEIAGQLEEYERQILDIVGVDRAGGSTALSESDGPSSEPSVEPSSSVDEPVGTSPSPSVQPSGSSSPSPSPSPTRTTSPSPSASGTQSGSPSPAPATGSPSPSAG
jgi:putative peptide zinc metalloprotease protein